jgi:hypothetical protein
MQRPTGVTVLAVVAAIGGVLLIFSGLALLGLGAIFAAFGGGFAFLLGLISLALGIAELAMAYGFWMVRPWAWTWGVALQAISVVFSLLELLLGGDLSNLVFSLIVAGVILYYLNMPDIRKVFAAPEKGWPFIGNIGA